LKSVGAALLAGCCVTSGATAQTVSWDAALVVDVATNASGGLEQGRSVLFKAHGGVTVDAEQLWGLSDLTIRGAAWASGGETFSDRYVGDWQTVSNIEAVDTARVAELWLEWAPSSSRFKLGVIDLNSEFDVNGAAAIFTNSAHGIGSEFSQIGLNGPSIYLVTGWGALAETTFDPGVIVAFGFFDGAQGDIDEPERALLDLSGDSTLAVGEVRVQEPMRITVGAWRHDGALSEMRHPALAEGAAAGAYAIAQTQIYRSDTAEWTAFARFGFAQPDRVVLAGYAGIGVRRDGYVFGLGGDESLGFAVAYASASGHWRESERMLGNATERAETAFEITYRVQATPNFAMQPSLHYIAAPSASARLDDALVIGVRFEAAVQSP